MKKKDYVGRFARLRRRIETEGGVVIPAGSIMKITNTWRGKFTVEAFDRSPSDQGGSETQTCRGVEEHEFDLLPKDPREQARLALAAALEIAACYGLGYEIAPGERRLRHDTVAVIEIPACDL